MVSLKTQTTDQQGAVSRSTGTQTRRQDLVEASGRKKLNQLGCFY